MPHETKLSTKLFIYQLQLCLCDHLRSNLKALRPSEGEKSWAIGLREIYRCACTEKGFLISLFYDREDFYNRLKVSLSSTLLASFCVAFDNTEILMPQQHESLVFSRATEVESS